MGSACDENFAMTTWFLRSMKTFWPNTSPGGIDEDWSSSLRAWGGLLPITQTALGAPLFPRVELPAQA